MTIREIYQRFDSIGSVVFSTIDEGYPETRIAHFFAEDEQGLYFRTMTTKPWYHQLKTNKTISVCGLAAPSEITHDSQGLPLFEPGYTIRVTGDVKEVDTEYIKEKAKTSEDFRLGYNDILKYKALKAFVIFKGRGEIFDYDFEEASRDHKLLRTKFTFNGGIYPNRGLVINDECVNCKACFNACSFKAISKGEIHFEIDQTKCDACGDCTLACNFNAIDVLIK